MYSVLNYLSHTSLVKRISVTILGIDRIIYKDFQYDKMFSWIF